MLNRATIRHRAAVGKAAFGTVEAIEIGADVGLEDAHARATGFDLRTLADEYVYLRLTPRRIQARRGANELAGRYLMRDGRWLV